MTMHIYIEIVKSVTQPFLSVCIVTKKSNVDQGMTGKVPKKAMAQGIIKNEIQNQEEERNVSIIQTKSTTNFSEIIQKFDKMQLYVIHDCFYDNKNMKTVANGSDYSIVV